MILLLNFSISNENNLKEFLDKIPIFEEFNKHKVLYEQKQQDLFIYFAGKFAKLSNKIVELQTKFKHNLNENKNTLELQKKSELAIGKPSELKFLLVLKNQIKLLRGALDKERHEKELITSKLNQIQSWNNFK